MLKVPLPVRSRAKIQTQICLNEKPLFFSSSTFPPKGSQREPVPKGGKQTSNPPTLHTGSRRKDTIDNLASYSRASYSPLHFWCLSSLFPLLGTSPEPDAKDLRKPPSSGKSPTIHPSLPPMKFSLYTVCSPH